MPSIAGARDSSNGRDRALAVIFLSALVGFPPFFVVSLAAGALGVEFRRFFAIGAVGRLVHFTAVACIPELLRRAF